MGAAAAGVEAAGEGVRYWSWGGCGVWYSREAEEEEECNADDDGEGYPATPAVPAGIGTVDAVAAEVRCVSGGCRSRDSYQ